MQHLFEKSKKFIIFLAGIAMIFTGVMTTSQAYAREITDNIVTSATLTPASGGAGDPKVNSNGSTVQLTLDFSLPNGINPGDTSTISLPEGFVFNSSVDFEVKSADGSVVARGKMDAQRNKLILTYTDYVKNHSDITGSIKAAVRADYQNNTNYGTSEFNITVNGHIVPAGNLTYQKWVGDSPTEIFAKWGSPHYDDNTATYYLRVNGSGKNLNSAVIHDTLETEGVSIIKDSLTIEHGTWLLNSQGGYEWQGNHTTLDPSAYTVTYGANNTSFTVRLNNLLGDGSGVLIKYRVEINHQMLNGEEIHNTAELNYTGQPEKHEAQSRTSWQSISGEANGYNYSISIHKTDESGKALAGAVFTVVRDSSGETIGTVTTDAAGHAELHGLLRDDYTLTETKAPQGYVAVAPIKITADQLKNDAKTAEITVKDPKATGSFAVKKIVAGDNVQKFAQQTYKMTYTCDDGHTGTLSVKGDGNAVQGPQLASGTVCSISEDQDSAHRDGFTVTTTQDSTRVTLSQNDTPVVTVTNDYQRIETTSVKVAKKWDDNNDKDGIRPQFVQLQLMADGEAVGNPVKISAQTGWSHTFDKLPVEKQGEKIRYTVTEVNVPDGYVSRISGDMTSGFTVTNSHTVPTPPSPITPSHPAQVSIPRKSEHKHLARTGIDTYGVLYFAAGMLALGIAMLGVMRRKHK